MCLVPGSGIAKVYWGRSGCAVTLCNVSGMQVRGRLLSGVPMTGSINPILSIFEKSSILARAGLEFEELLQGKHRSNLEERSHARRPQQTDH